MNKINARTIANEYVKAVKEAGIPVVSAYLFGSQARGTAQEGSDIDICIVSPLFGKNKHKEMLELTKLRRNINVLIEPHPLSPQDLEKESSGIGQAIKNHGILIY